MIRCHLEYLASILDRTEVSRLSTREESLPCCPHGKAKALLIVSKVEAKMS